MPSRKWSTREARAENLISAPGFNREYDQIKGTLNGGLDRTSTLNSWATRAKVVDKALHATSLTTNVAMNSGYLLSNNSSFMFDSLCYDNYTGGWLTNTEVNTTGFKEGIAHAEISLFAWCHHSLSTNNNKGIRFQVTWNGSVVAETGFFYHPWPNPYICVDFPIAGNGTLALNFAYTAPMPSVDTTTATIPQAFFGGGQILLIGRWR